MKNTLGYIIGFATMLMVFAMIYIVGGIYDGVSNLVVEPYFFRTGLMSANQTGVPLTVSEIGQRGLRDWLIQKFVTEYFYVVPDNENIAMRAGGTTSVLPKMASRDVVRKWEKTELQKIRDLAAAGALRKVRVFNEIFKSNNSNYWHVDYELKTWYKPNDMNDVPETTRGTMYIQIQNVDAVGKLKRNIDKVQRALIRGDDPAVVFVFQVTDVIEE